MPEAIKISQLLNEIDDTINSKFGNKTFWITAEITDVKKQADKRWCFLKFIEKEGAQITTEIKGVFWATSYHHIENFERLTKQTFATGLQITCNVKVRFNKRFGLDLEVKEIDFAYTIGKVELEKQQTLERLVTENSTIIKQVGEEYYTHNKRLQLPIVIQRIALITAPNSDGQRDFMQEIIQNQYGYAFNVTEFLTQIQGDNAPGLIIEKLKIIESNASLFDVVAIVRGGGSLLDLRPFDAYELCQYVAGFPVPILSGIGHDRNTSIVDMLVRQHKTPTKVAAEILDHNYNFEYGINELKNRLLNSVDSLLNDAKQNLQQYRRTVKAYSPSSILNKGYAILTVNNKIIVNPDLIKPGDEIKTVLRNELIHSTVTKKTSNEFDL